MLDLVVRCAVLGVLSAGTLGAPVDNIPLGDCSGNGSGVVLVALADHRMADIDGSADGVPDDDSAGAPCAGRLVLPPPGPLELAPVPKSVRRL